MSIDGCLLSRPYNFETKQICHLGVFKDTFAWIPICMNSFMLTSDKVSIYPDSFYRVDSRNLHLI